MSWASGLSFNADGTGVVAHAGSLAVRLLADRVGLTAALSAGLSRRSFVPVHDRGRVLVDVATMLAAGAEAIADIDTLRHQDQVLGPVASPPTVWRALAELTPARLRRVEKARAKTRAASYGSGRELAIVWDDMWRRAADLAEEEGPIRVIRTWAPALTLDEFLKTRALEITVHGMDMALALGREPWATSEGVDVTVKILQGLLGPELPEALEWDELTFIDKGTGRSPLTDDERAALGRLAERFPLLA